MYFNDIFFGIDLPKSLTKKEFYYYLEKYKQGDLNAREQLILHNIRLVLNQINKRFSNTPYDKKELVSIGIVGLIKSVDTFDTEKNIEFSTYAIKCIDNEILYFFRKAKKYANDQSIYTPIGTYKNGKEIRIEDILEDDTSDFVSDYEDQITYNEVRKVVYSLPDRDREIILLYFGFIDNHTYTQKEIADKLEISQSYVARLITKIVKRIGIQLQNNGVIETVDRSDKKTKFSPIRSIKVKASSNTPTIDTKSVEKSKQITPSIETENVIIPKSEERNNVKMGRKLQTIYEYLKEYTSEEIDVMLSKLSDEEMSLIRLRYGEDLNNPVASSTWGKEQNNKFYGSLIPKMKKLLSNSKEKEIVTPQLTIPEELQKEISQSNKSEIEKEDCVRILELMRTLNFGEMLKTLTPKEAVIICLIFGYVDGKYFKAESVAEFLGIENEEVIETTKKVLSLYKENINQIIDKTDEVVTLPSLVLKKKEN